MPPSAPLALRRSVASSLHPLHLDQALQCLLQQTHRNLDVMIILNGADPPLRDLCHALAADDSRIRILELPEANLAAALNLALEAARFDLIARMDADDLCPPERLERQAAFMVKNPGIAAVGCAWELIDPDGRTITIVRPPPEPAHLRWRLLLGNCLAHGSMMLQRGAVLKAGGYDTRCERAQDYDLWLRLAWPSGSGIAALPDVLYQYRTRDPGDPGRSTAQQAAIAAPAMLELWRQLEPVRGQDADLLAAALAAAIARDDGPFSGTAALEGLLARSPSREALLAWLFAQWSQPPMHRRAAEICRLSRLREVSAELGEAGIGELYLWGAGDHTRWILENQSEFGVRVLGIVDDRVAGERYGLAVQPPAVLKPGECALISSDWFEEQIWAASEPHRARGVRIWRLYG